MHHTYYYAMDRYSYKFWRLLGKMWPHFFLPCTHAIRNLISEYRLVAMVINPHCKEIIMNGRWFGIWIFSTRLPPPQMHGKQFSNWMYLYTSLCLQSCVYDKHTCTIAHDPHTPSCVHCIIYSCITGTDKYRGTHFCSKALDSHFIYYYVTQLLNVRHNIREYEKLY